MKSMVLPLCALLVLGGCVKNISSDDYSETDAGGVVETYKGTILSVRKVKVKSSDRLEDNKTGLIGGGVGGAVLGSQFGKGRGSTVGAVAGAALGALGGTLLEKKLKTQDGLEYTVQLRNGRIVSIVQGVSAPMAPGQHVLVLMNRKGRSRVIPDQSPSHADLKSKKPSQKNRGRTIVVIED